VKRFYWRWYEKEPGGTGREGESMNLPRTTQCDPKCWMCIQNGECPFKKTIEHFMKGIPEYKPKVNVTLEKKE
jgi:hypothetical protein